MSAKFTLYPRYKHHSDRLNEGHIRHPKGINVDQTSPTNMSRPERLSRLPEVQFLVSLRKSSIYELVKRGVFPTSVRLTQRAVGWPASSIDSWIAERIKAGRE